MGCGCKKKNNVDATTQSTNVTVQVVETSQVPPNNISLTDVQQQQVDAIVDKINQINTNS